VFSSICLSAIVTAPLATIASSIATLTLAPPSVERLNGEKIRTVEVGQQVIITTTFTYQEISTIQQEAEISFIGLIEVRDPYGITKHLAYQANVIELDDERTIGVSWRAEEQSAIYQPPEYVVRAFAITGFEQPQVLSSVQESFVTIVE